MFACITFIWTPYFEKVPQAIVKTWAVITHSRVSAAWPLDGSTRPPIESYHSMSFPLSVSRWRVSKQKIITRPQTSSRLLVQRSAMSKSLVTDPVTLGFDSIERNSAAHNSAVFKAAQPNWLKIMKCVFL